MIRAGQPGLVIDISKTVEQKASSFICHASQLGDAEAVRASIRERAARLGGPYGIAFAEGFDRVSVPSTEVDQLAF